LSQVQARRRLPAADSLPWSPAHCAARVQAVNADGATLAVAYSDRVPGSGSGSGYGSEAGAFDAAVPLHAVRKRWSAEALGRLAVDAAVPVRSEVQCAQ
jgi:hypothetical protein